MMGRSSPVMRLENLVCVPEADKSRGGIRMAKGGKYKNSRTVRDS